MALLRGAPGRRLEAAALDRALDRAALDESGEVVGLAAQRELEGEALAAQPGFLEQHVPAADARAARDAGDLLLEVHAHRLLAQVGRQPGAPGAFGARRGDVQG